MGRVSDLKNLFEKGSPSPQRVSVAPPKKIDIPESELKKEVVEEPKENPAVVETNEPPMEQELKVEDDSAEQESAPVEEAEESKPEESLASDDVLAVVGEAAASKEETPAAEPSESSSKDAPEALEDASKDSNGE